MRALQPSPAPAYCHAYGSTSLSAGTTCFRSCGAPTELHRCGARAARIPAAISRHVRGLELHLGRPLFRRLHRRVELTVPGKRLAGGLAAGFSQIQRSLDAVRIFTTRHLRLAVEPAFASRWLVARLGEFSANHPDIELELESSDELRVLGRDTDIAIRFLGPKARRPGKRARRLFSLDGFPVIAQSLELKRSPRADAEI
jgi:LysR family glycine cleavage system transcriptional activator